MRTSEIRRAFLEFFQEREHRLVPSASLVPFEDDPSLLLTVAGMQPLKQFFLGAAQPPASRLTSVQKCFRTVDLDEVGHTARHLTFFEMLGNFSFGDYFKPEAIRFGWELSTEVLGLDPERIWITVFEGMEGVPGDEEAIEHWLQVGVPAERIQRLGESENFWKAGPTGPCGPNTELYLDRGPSFGPEGGPAVGGDRYLEFWNLVFMQYDRGADGSLEPLPAKNIDTGAGLERIAAILQDKPSVFDTDGFQPLIRWAEARTDRRYRATERDDQAFRVLADHGRAMTFLGADGVRPSNEGRGYVLRRIIRRAVSEAGYLGIGVDELPGLCEPVIEGWSEAYPELREQAGAVVDMVGAEAEQFARTLDQGRRLLAEVIDRSRAAGAVSGEDAFRLHDTYGFPIDLTVEAGREAGLDVDVSGFEARMADQRERSRAAGAGDGSGKELTERAAALAATAPATEFVGYDELDVEATVVASEVLAAAALVKLDQSPFYAQGGGQVSDTGTIATSSGGEARVRDVLRLGDDQMLVVEPVEGLGVGSAVRARVDVPSRRATQANHTATHILNWALRTELGPDIRQAGSYVGPDKLRFDFTHRGKIPDDALERIEALVNERIRADDAVRASVMPRAEADELGAIGLFEEKYGDTVRVLATGEFSRELCGGTHVAHTGEIGPFVLASEGSVGASARRIEALTGEAVVAMYRERLARLTETVSAREERIGELERELKAARTGSVDVGEMVGSAERIGDVRVVARSLDVADMDDLLRVSDRIRGDLGGDAVVVLAAEVGGKAMLVATAGDDAVEAGVSAADIVRAIAPSVGGKGGGKPAMARAGGKDPSGIPDAVAEVPATVASALGVASS